MGEALFQRLTKGGELRNSGEGKTYQKAPPQKWFGSPPLMMISPPLCSRNVILLRGNGHRPDKSHFLRPPKLGSNGALYSTFSPPNIARYVLPPPLQIPNYYLQLEHFADSVWSGHFPESKNYVSEADSSWKVPEIPQRDRERERERESDFLANFQTPKVENSEPEEKLPYPH